MILTTNRTIYGIDIELHKSLNKFYTPKKNTTLNEKFNILDNYIPKINEFPNLQYLSIGVGGFRTLDNTGNNINNFSAINASLYETIPFCLVDINNDLTDEEQKRYRFRKEIIINNKNYIAYYLKVIAKEDIKTYNYYVMIHNIDNKQKIEKANLVQFDVLNPKRKVLTKNDFISNYKTVICKADLKIEFSEFDISRLTDACKILGKDIKDISEIGVMYGIDTVIDAACVQLGYYSDISIDVINDINTDGSFVMTLTLGGLETVEIF